MYTSKKDIGQTNDRRQRGVSSHNGRMASGSMKGALLPYTKGTLSTQSPGQTQPCVQPQILHQHRYTSRIKVSNKTNLLYVCTSWGFCPAINYTYDIMQIIHRKSKGK